MKDPRKRLGASQADAQEVKSHPYFKEVDWQAMLEKRVPVPYVPKFVSILIYNKYIIKYIL